MKVSPFSVLLLASSFLGGLGSELRGAKNMEDNDERELLDIADHPMGEGIPVFLADEQVPPDLLNNPDREVGVDFQRGRKPRAQLSPNLNEKRGAKILGLDNTIIDLDTEDAERINVYSPEQYQLSGDGKYVTHKETGDKIPLTVFYRDDKKNGVGITFSTDNLGRLIHVRVAPKDDIGQLDSEKAQVQNFQRLDDTDLLVGYLDEDIELSKLPPYGKPVTLEEKPLPDDLLATPKNQGNRRRAQASSTPRTRFGKRCLTWDFLDIAITTDRGFMQKYPDHEARARAIFAEAARIYWLESCIYLNMWRYENTVERSWWWESFPQFTRISGCGPDFGAIDLLKWEVTMRKGNVYRDAWHMFTGTDFQDGRVIGCAWRSSIVCGSKDWGYGVEHMTFTTNLRLQAVVFAHELGHNLNQRHLTTIEGRYIMEAGVSTAPFGFRSDIASAIRSLVLESNVCGWFDDPDRS